MSTSKNNSSESSESSKSSNSYPNKDAIEVSSTEEILAKNLENNLFMAKQDKELQEKKWLGGLKPTKQKVTEVQAAIANGEKLGVEEKPWDTEGLSKEEQAKKAKGMVEASGPIKNPPANKDGTQALSTHCTSEVSPQVTAESNELYGATGNIMKPDRLMKPLEAIGNERPKQGEKPHYPQSVRQQVEEHDRMIKEAENDDILSDETIRQIKNIAGKNPVTKAMIDKAKEFSKQNKEKMQDQCMDLVAMYNIAQAKPFFFISPAEARMAIDYVKQCRTGYTQDLDAQDKADQFVYEFIRSIGEINVETDPSKTKDMLHPDIHAEIQGDIERICGITMGDEISGTLTGDKLRSMKPYTPVEAFISTVNELQSIKMPEDREADEGSDVPKFLIYNSTYNSTIVTPGVLGITLDHINKALSVLEANDLTCDVIFMNAFRIADVRNFGNTIFKEYTKKEFLKRRVSGSIFGAEVYLCNKLEDNQVIFGSLNLLPEHGIFLNTLLV